jgi:hypothetical protein
MTADGHIRYTIRSGGPWTDLHDLNAEIVLPGPGPVQAVSADVRGVVYIGGRPDSQQLVMFVTADGQLWQVQGNGSLPFTWLQPKNVSSQLVIPGPVTAVSVVSTGSTTQIMFATADGNLWHSTRDGFGNFQALGDVNLVFAIPGPVVAVAAAWGGEDEAQFMFATADGRLWHTLRKQNGNWTGLGAVNDVVAVPGPVVAVAATNAGRVSDKDSTNVSETQYMFTTSNGRLWHTRRLKDGNWTPLKDMRSEFPNLGPVRAVCAATAGVDETQYMFTTTDGHLWHSLRKEGGQWTALGDVNAVVPAIPGPASAVSGSKGFFIFTT